MKSSTQAQLSSARMEELFSGYQAVTPHFKVVETDRHGRPCPEETKDGLEDGGVDKARAVKARHKDPRESRTVFVGNLPATVTRRKLKQLFSRHGKVDSVRLRSMVVEKGKLPVRVAKRKQQQITSPTVNAYVVFDDEEAAEKALSLNGASIDGRHIRVDFAGRAKEHAYERSVFVGGLPYSADDEEVRELFTKYGDVESVRVVREPKTGTGKGFGFVTYLDRSGVMFALQHRRGIELNGKKLRVMKSQEASGDDESKSVGRFSAVRTTKRTKIKKGVRKRETKNAAPKRRVLEKQKHNRGAGKGYKETGGRGSEGPGIASVRPSRTFHKKKEAKKREREERRRALKEAVSKRRRNQKYRQSQSVA